MQDSRRIELENSNFLFSIGFEAHSRLGVHVWGFKRFNVFLDQIVHRINILIILSLVLSSDKPTLKTIRHFLGDQLMREVVDFFFSVDIRRSFWKLKSRFRPKKEPIILIRLKKSCLNAPKQNQLPTTRLVFKWKRDILETIFSLSFIDCSKSFLILSSIMWTTLVIITRTFVVE